MAAQPHSTGIDTLAQRGQTIAQSSSLPYFDDFFRGMQDVWDAHANPDGHVLMCVAENKQNYQALLDKLATCSDRRPETAGYQSMRGLQRFAEAICTVVEETIAPGTMLRRNGLTIASGCGSLFDNVVHCLINPGDAVLIPTPTYAALLNDTGIKAGGIVVPCPMDTTTPEAPSHVLPRPSLTTECLETGLKAAHDAQLTARLLILLHPGNPTGACLSREELLAAIAWARTNGLHVIIDEVYAAGCFYGVDGDASAPGHTLFESAASILAPTGAAGNRAEPDLGDHVHLMWGFSKDWGVSGYRIGMLYSHNESLNAALGNINYFSAVSNFVQESMAEVLEDVDWSKEYLAANARIVQENYTAAWKVLQAAGVPCLPADGGMYIWIDLRACLKHSVGSPATSEIASRHKPATAALMTATDFYKREFDIAGIPWAQEDALQQELFKEHKVLMTPGRACCTSRAGFFRLCVCWMSSPEGTVEGARRVAAFYKAHCGSQEE